MAHVERDEEQELGDLAGSSQRFAGTEEEQGLLEDQKADGGREDDAEPYQTPRSTSRPWKWKTMLWSDSATAAVLGLVVCLGFLIIVTRRPAPETGLEEPVAAPEGVQRNDYLLNPRDWDFDEAPQRREYFWTVRDQMHNLDGVDRQMMLVNNQYPGPIIEANEGDMIVVHVDNAAVNATSIHWHGLYQNGTPHMDGTTGITQCAIASGATFTYVQPRWW